MTKVKVVKEKDREVSDMFNEVLGTGDHVNISICYPKYLDLKIHMEKVIQICSIFFDAKIILRYKEFDAPVAMAKEYIREVREHYEKVFSFAFSDEEMMTGISEERSKKFSEIYMSLKKDKYINNFIILCNSLALGRDAFKDPNETDHRYITNMASDFSPFPFTSLDIKRLLVLITTETSYDSAGKLEDEIAYATRFILLSLGKLWTLTFGIYKLMSSPDIDVDEFIRVIMKNIKEVKKHIPRCDKAFKKIENSVHLLKENFGEYYKDFIETKNQTIIMENFVLDVAKVTDADAETTMQFKKIISYYRKIAGEQVKNPKVKVLFDKVEEHLSMLEKHENLTKVEKEQKEEMMEKEKAKGTTGGKSKKENKEEAVDEKLMKTREENSKKSVEELAKEFNKK